MVQSREWEGEEGFMLMFKLDWQALRINSDSDSIILGKYECSDDKPNSNVDLH